MRLIKKHNKVAPEIDREAIVLEQTKIIGNVLISRGASVWYGSVIRGDVNRIIIGENTNIQDNCVVHGSTGRGDTIIGSNCTIGHRAILHGCHIRNNVLIGMGAIVLDGAYIESNAIVAAGAVVLEHTYIKSGELWAGIPAKKVKVMDIDHLRRVNIKSAEKYILLSQTHKNT